MTFYILRTEYPYFFSILALFIKILRKYTELFMFWDTLKNTDGWNVRFFTKYKNAWSSHVCWSINSIRNDLFSHVYLRVHFLSIHFFLGWPPNDLIWPIISELANVIGSNCWRITFQTDQMGKATSIFRRITNSWLYHSNFKHMVSLIF